MERLKTSSTAILITILILISVLSTTAFANGQTAATPEFQWEKQYGGPASISNSIGCLIQTSDGGYAFLATGGGEYYRDYRPNVWLVKIDAKGETQWRKLFFYGGTLGLVQTSDNGYVLAGHDNITSGTVLYKLDSKGNPQWNITYPYSGCNKMLLAKDGGFTLAGVENSKVWLAKVGLNAQFLWHKTYQAKFDKGVSCLLQAKDGSYLILGNSIINPDQDGSPSSLVMLKTDSSGTLLWKSIYNKNMSGWGGQSITQTSDDNYVIMDNTNTSAAVFKTDQNGKIQWTQNYPDIGIINSIIETSDGGLALGGSYCIIRLARTDSQGNLTWSITAGNLNQVVPFVGRQFYVSVTGFLETSDGCLVLAGICHNDNPYQAAYYVTKTKPFLPAFNPVSSLPKVPSTLPANLELPTPVPSGDSASQAAQELTTTQTVIILAILILFIAVAVVTVITRKKAVKGL